MTDPKAIRNQIITILKDADPKNGDNKSITRWEEGEPPKRSWPGFPWGWVEWAGGPVSPPVGTKAEIFDGFYIVVVDKHLMAGKAEDSVMEFAETVKTALKSDPTIGGLVAFSWVSNLEKQKVFIESEGDYSFVALRVTLSTRRRE